MNENIDTRNVLHEPKWPKGYYDVAMAFGQGPTLDIQTKKKASDVSQDPSLETEINTWGRTTAVAMGYLALKGQYREAIWSGGRTGGDKFPSEAELMQQTMYQVFGTAQIEKQYDQPESRSTNTLENFVHSLNMMDELTTESRPFQRMVFVCSDFHASRIKMMASLFNIHDVDVLSSEQIIKIMVADATLDDFILEKAADALIGERNKTVNARQALATWIARRIDPLNVGLNRTGEGEYKSFVGGGETLGDSSNAFTPYEKAAEQFPGTSEATTHTKRMQNEDMFIEGLARMPANWLGFIADIKSDTRLNAIISNVQKIHPTFFSSLGINFLESLDEIRQKLSRFKKEKRTFVSLDHTTYDGKKTFPAVEKILNNRQRQRKST
jgi:hypothetical protein